MRADLTGAALALFTALLTAWLVERRARSGTAVGRYASIDGLRGYLAFCVFLHHANIEYFFLKSHVWAWKPAGLFAYCGRGSVVLFFMITSFLFCSKLIDGRRQPIDWIRLYVSRVLRIGPLYVVVTSGLILTVLWQTGFRLAQPLPSFLLQIATALDLGMSGLPELNGMKNAALIVAGVFWTLRYEWMFYAALPLLALALRVRVPVACFAFPLLAYLLMLEPAEDYLAYLPFLAGMVSAFLVRLAAVARLARTPIASVMVAALLTCAVLFVPYPEGRVGVALLAGAFLLIAAGNDLFGILAWRISRALGAISYSIYLLHGILLYLAVNLVLGAEHVAALGAWGFWAFIDLLAPLLILASHLTYRYVEQPCLAATGRVSGWLTVSRAIAPSQALKRMDPS